MRELALSYGIIPFYMGIPKNHDEFIMDIPKILESDGFNKDDLVLVIGGSFGYIRVFSKRRAQRCGNVSYTVLIKRYSI